MNEDLKKFVATYLRVVTIAVVPLVITSFLTIPYSLGGHPGESDAREHTFAQHMT